MSVEAGFSQVDLMDVLPEKRSCDVPLSGRGIYLKQGERQSFFLVLDFMDFDRKAVTILSEAAASALPEGTQVHIVTTHNHGCASYFLTDMERFASHAAACAREAVQKAQRAKVRIAAGRIGEDISYFRRLYVPQAGGSFTCFYGIDSLEKGTAAPFVKNALEALEKGYLAFTAAGTSPQEGDLSFLPGDPGLAVLEFKSLDDQPLGNIVRFACHAVCCNTPDVYSADYPGHLRQMMEGSFGGVSVFLNGPCAEIAPVMTKKSSETGKGFAGVLFRTARELLEKTAFSALETFEDISCSISLPVREEILNRKVIVPEAPPKTRLERQRVKDSLPFLTGIYSNGEEQLSDRITLSTALVTLNDWKLLFFSGETFHQTAEEITGVFPRCRWITVTEHGRTAMYLPPEKEYQRGGYEPTCAVISSEGEKELRKQMLAFLKAHLP